jgi:hypothetical protein
LGSGRDCPRFDSGHLGGRYQACRPLPPLESQSSSIVTFSCTTLTLPAPTDLISHTICRSCLLLHSLAASSQSSRAQSEFPAAETLQGPSCVQRPEQHEHHAIPLHLLAPPRPLQSIHSPVLSPGYVYSQTAAMTADNLSSPLDMNQHLHHDHLVQRSKSMPITSAHTGPTPLQGPKKAPTPTQPAIEDASRPSSSRHSADAMGESNTLARQLSNASDDSTTSRRPSTPRSQTDPQPDTLASLMSLTTRPRNRSPYSRSHYRSQSGSALPSAPPMTRAHSLPTVMQPSGGLMLSPAPMSLARPSSPLRSPKLSRSPRALDPRPYTAGTPERYSSGIRPTSIGSFEGAPSVCDISEDAELELTPRVGTTVSSLYSSTGSLSRRRRPASPLYQVSAPFGAPPTSNPSVSTPTSTASSPLLVPSRFNENYPMSHASSSMPSTPTSMRSRSPSISSLETIEDSPDAEEEAIEADRIRRLKAAADREDGGDARRSSLDVPEGRGRSLGFGKRDSRKRWSVCGAERRGDLDLETIWED